MKSSEYAAGWHVVLAALEGDGAKPLEILMIAGRHDERATRVQELARQHQIPLQSMSRGDLDLRAPGVRHQGVLALMPERELDAEDVLEQPAQPHSLILALDGVQDPHNLGACLRTAEAAGVNAVVIPRDRSASLTPTAQKASAGASERVSVVAVTNLVRSLRRLQELGYWLTGLAGDAGESLYDVDLTGPLVLVLGAEGEGLRRLTRETCDRLVRIPMQGQADSLNVSVATGVCLFEVMRQRSAARRKQVTR